MCPQMACLRECIVALIAFVWLFSTMCFQMWPQRVCPRKGIVALVAFVWLFSTVRLQMCLQGACIRRCKVTLVAYVWLVSIVRFQMYSQIACPKRGIVALAAFACFFSFIIFVSQGNTYITPIFTGIIIYKMLIHNHQFGFLFLSVISVSNWKNNDCEVEESTNESESHCWRQY